jgi:hypothetical protein
VANPQHAKTPKLNALLIGKRTVPSGCRVLNVSQQGMSLQCDPDGRLLTFSSGDAVDIFLSVQHANGHNKFTIPAIVSHVDESLIDVVFHCTDTELAGLIESYRTSESHDLEASIDHRLISKTGVQAKPVAVNEALGEREGTVTATPRSMPSFYTGLLLLFITSLVLLGAYYYISSINKRLTNLESISRTHTEELSEVQSQVFSSRLQDGRYASLNARMKALTDAFQSFEKRVSTALLQAPSAEALGEPVTVAGSLAADPPDQPTQPPVSKPAMPEPTPLAQAKTEQKPAPKPVATPEKVAVTGEKSTSPSVIDEIKPSTQKYPAIDTGPTPQAVVTSTPPGTTTRPAEEKRLVDQKPVREESTTVEKSKTETAILKDAEDMTAVKPGAPSKADQTKAKSQPQAKSPMDTAQPSMATVKAMAADGPWVINILSSPSKAYVEKMRATATARGFDTIIASAKVKGKQYWRLQVPGFESMSAAKRAAEPVKASLKIQDVWIFKRKR